MVKTNAPISLFKWIWHSYLKTALIPLVLVELVFIGIYFFTNGWTQKEMVNLLREEVQTELQEIAAREAVVIQQQLAGITYTTDIYRQQAEKALQMPTAVRPEDARRLTYSPEGVYYTKEDKQEGGAAVFYSGYVPVGEAQRAKVGRTLALESLMKDIQQSHPLVDSLYFNTHDSLNVIYPYFDALAQYAPRINIPTFNFYYEADAQHNPSGKVRWTDAYLDPAGHGWMASAIAPVYNGEFLEGVVGIDVTINKITDYILDLDIPWSGYGVLIGKDGTILALPPNGEKDWGLNELKEHHYEEAVQQDTFKPDDFNLYKRPDLTTIAQAVSQQDSGFQDIQLNSKSIVASWSTVPETGWKLLVLVPEENIYSKVNQMSQQLFDIGTLMIAGLIFFYCIFFLVLYQKSRKMSTNISQPLVEINHMVQRIGSGDYLQKVPDFPVQELQETAAQLVSMSQQLGTANESLLETQGILKKKESDLQALVNSIDDVIFELDEQGVFRNVWANDPTMLTRPQEEIQGASLQEIFDADKAAFYQAKIRKVLDTLEPDILDYEMPTSRGTRWFQARIASINSDARTVSISARDITERKEMERSIITAKEEAEKASMAKSQFLSNMSHELRTPLNAVLGFAQLLAIDPEAPLTENQRESVKEIEKAGNHLLSLINEVLDLAKIESGKLSLSIEFVQVEMVMGEVFSMIRPLAKQHDIRLKCGSADCMEQFVSADIIRLKQILLNLFSNAIKYNRPQGEVCFHCERAGQFIRFHVTDTGLGIPKTELEAIFEPFYRLGATSNQVEGTGIGLTVARQLVQLMGGSIDAESQEGVGSHFWFELPCAAGTGLPIGMTDSHTYRGVEKQAYVGSYEVLYVEDNRANLHLVERILANYPQVKMFSATSGELGVDLARAHRPQLILLDINLPVMDGFEVLKRLKSYPETKDIPVIALSANAIAKDINKGLNAGFAAYLTKPINVPNFMEILMKFIKSQ